VRGDDDIAGSRRQQEKEEKRKTHSGRKSQSAQGRLPEE